MAHPGASLILPAAENLVFYVTGQVRSPGAYSVSSDMTLRMALARGGGVSDMGSMKKVKIVRKGVHLKDVKPDETQIEPGDVINVGERLF